jgi:hypothetical protein
MKSEKPLKLDPALKAIGGTKLGDYWFFQKSPSVLFMAVLLICVLLLVILIKR